ncbi:hypothetical protein [Actinophytocola sp. KF-1]
MTASEHDARLRSDVLALADKVDARIQGVLDRLHIDSADPRYERVIDAIMGLCLVVDAARAYAHDDVAHGDDLAKSVGRYAGRVLDGVE